MKKIKSLFVILMTLNFSLHASFPVKRTSEVLLTENALIDNIDSNSISTATTVAGDNQIVALLLCWFLGILGVHRFYLGDTWQGIVQLLTLGGLGVWVLVDFILICVGELGPGW